MAGPLSALLMSYLGASPMDTQKLLVSPSGNEPIAVKLLSSPDCLTDGQCRAISANVRTGATARIIERSTAFREVPHIATSANRDEGE